MQEERIEEIMRAMEGATYRLADGRKIELMRTLTALHDRRGYTIRPEEAERKAATLDEDINRFFGKTLTFREAILALNYGARGEYGDVKNLSVDTLLNFIRIYLNSDTRQAAYKFQRGDQKAQRLGVTGSTRGDSARKNWEAMLEYTRDRWRDFETQQGGTASPKDPWATIRRINMANAYRWFVRCSGLVTPAQAAWAESQRPQAGEEEARLNLLFAGYKSQGRNIGGELDRLERTTPPADRYWA